MKKFILTGSIADTDHARIVDLLTRRMLPRALRLGPLVLGALALGAVWSWPLVDATLAARGLVLPAWLPLALVLVMLGVLVAMARVRQARVWTGLARNPNRAGDKTFALTPDGLRMKGATGYSFTTWAGFVDVVDDPQGLLVLTGPLEYVVLPQAAFADAAEKTAVKAQIADWIAAARG